MKGTLGFAVSSVTACIPTVLGLFPPRPAPPVPATDSVKYLTRLGSSGTLFGNTTFEQYIDHLNPGLGTFSQRYWWNAEYWKGPGSPVCPFYHFDGRRN